MTPITEDGRTLADIMTHDPETATADTTIHDVATMMASEDIGTVLIVTDGQLSGIVTDRDIVTKAVARGLDTTTEVIGPIATEMLVTGTPGMSIRAAAELMAERRIRRIPVLDHGQIVGIVSMQDVAQSVVPTVTGVTEQAITAT